MKQTTTLIILLFVFNLTFGQKDDGIKIPKTEETNKYGFTEICELDNITAKELYNLTKLFLTKKHSDKEFFIDIPEKELYDNGSFPADMNVSNIPMTYTVLYIISCEFKENKVRITISDFKVSTNSQGTTSEVVLENHFNNMNAVKRGKKYARKMKESLSKSIIEQSEKLISELKQNLTKKKTEW
tara:strand:- start:884 stop:1438 length:555 start_codon:yes stop_codon:yes gene_type:complete